MYSFNQLPSYTGDKELQGLQILKFICAILVVQLHTYSLFGDILLPVCRIAVPVFFIISGYFIVSCEGTVLSNKIRSVFIKILKITVYVTLAYFAFDILVRLINHEGFDEYTNPSFWMIEILFGTSAQVHLWYLTSYLQALILIFVLLKVRSFPLLLIFIPIGIVMNLLIGSYGFLFFDSDNSLLLSRNVLTIGLPCVLIGMIIRIYESRLPSARVVLYLWILSLVALYVEHFSINHYDGDIIIMTMPVAILTFILFLRMKCNNKYLGIIGMWGKRYSLDIYLWHRMVAFVFCYVQANTGLHPGLNTIFVSCLTLVVSALVKPSTLPSRCYNRIKAAI